MSLIFQNPVIFCKPNYKKIHNHMYNELKIFEELMQVMFHPKNMHKFVDWGFEF